MLIAWYINTLDRLSTFMGLFIR